MNDTDHEIDAAAIAVGRLTVGRLKELLATVEDWRPVVLATDGWYDHVATVGIPTDEPYCCLTFFHGEEWDARDL